MFHCDLLERILFVKILVPSRCYKDKRAHARDDVRACIYDARNRKDSNIDNKICLRINFKLASWCIPSFCSSCTLWSHEKAKRGLFSRRTKLQPLAEIRSDLRSILPEKSAGVFFLLDFANVHSTFRFFCSILSKDKVQNEVCPAV